MSNRPPRSPIAPARKISEDSAREIERALGLPPGDLDHDPDTPRTDPKDIDPKLMADITMLTYSHSRLTGTVDGAMLTSLITLAG